VIDLGGGTLDVTIMEFGKGVFEVKATSGDTRLGGTDMDRLVFDHLVEGFRAQTGIDLRADPRAAARLLEASEVAKVELTNSATAHVSLPYIGMAAGQAKHLDMELTQAELERLVRPVIESCRRPLEQALHDAAISADRVDRVVFVGGPTRMPVVRRFFEELLGRKAEMGVDPMECVAAGAAIQAGVLSGEVKDIVLVDVTPLTLGLETLGGVATPLIARNTPIPVKKSEVFTTAADMQTSVTVHVYQGERPMAADNTSLGEFNLDGLAPAPRGMPKIEVSFDIDANGILSAAARDMATGRSQSIRITGSTRLAEDVKKRMIDEAERYAQEDKRRREDAEALNAADAMCYQAEKTVADFGDKLTDELKARIEALRREVRDAIGRKDAVRARDKSEQLGKALKEAGAVIYAQRPDAGVFRETVVPPASGEARPSGSGPRGRVVDADYRESR
jgi:molecular chaperone DnaK